MILTEVLELFLGYLEKIPYNLTNATLWLLSILTIIDVSLNAFKLEDIDLKKYLVEKAFRAGMLLFIIKNYDWLLKEIKEGFLKVSALALNAGPSSYIEAPSLIVDIGLDMAKKINDVHNAFLSPIDSLTFFILSLLIILAFAFIAFQVVMVLLEYYILCGFALVFIPFGILKTSESYFQSVLKTIFGCCLKLSILNLILILSEKILSTYINIEVSKMEQIFVILVTIIFLAMLIMSVPALATSLITGTPSLDASQALRNAAAGASGAMAGVAMAAGVAGQTASTAVDVGKGAASGASKGANMGAKLGSMAGPVGTVIGGAIGGAAGAVGGAAVGAARSAGKFAMKKAGLSPGGKGGPKGASAGGGTGGSKGASAGGGTGGSKGTNAGTGGSKGTNAGTGSSRGANAGTGGSKGTNTDTGSSRGANADTGASKGAKTNPSSSQGASADTGASNSTKTNPSPSQGASADTGASNSTKTNPSPSQGANKK